MKLRDRLVDILRAEACGEDLVQDDDSCEIIVCAKRSDGSVYEIGRVSESLAYQSRGDAISAINIIKFHK